MKTIEPKTAFLKSPEAVQFAEFITHPVMRQGVEIALQQFVVNQLPTSDMTAAAISAIALEGAKRYISILLNLTEPEQPPTPDHSGNLQWPSKPQPSHSKPLTSRPKGSKTQPPPQA